MFKKLALKYFTNITRSIISKSNFGKKNMLVASYSWALIALEMCWKVNFGHRLMFLKCGLNVLESRHSELEFGHKFRIFLIKNQEIYCRFNVAHRVTQNLDSNYVLIEGRKNGSLPFCSRNWIWNIFPI